MVPPTHKDAVACLITFKLPHRRALCNRFCSAMANTSHINPAEDMRRTKRVPPPRKGVAPPRKSNRIRTTKKKSDDSDDDDVPPHLLKPPPETLTTMPTLVRVSLSHDNLPPPPSPTGGGGFPT